ncbi:hypothetical protein cce_0620 [Crocosphaera subtropica ATCC 51142]|uniref:DUF29 domain-containing protein n=1 Tax=Crocosphaera subtropica (strain ATCC 51142 / BH68) TaxID=43989 RepID=B1WQ49_CROS5|nr:DUF29 domain-containing protein [Crocosphaera subtropica]ACB49971.1 hypothetical protein cce_0620 [Crocosphaera subtropica ATCC 51142]
MKLILCNGLDEQANLLLKGKYEQLDVINLVEEIQALGRSEVRETFNLLKQIIAHKLKLEYSQLIYPRKHWQDEIDEFYEQLGLFLTKTVRNKLDLYKIYQAAKKKVLKQYDVNLLNKCPYSWDDLLAELDD